MKIKQLQLIGITLLATAAFVRFAMAASVAWNPNPPGDNVTAYKVYEHVGANYVLIATTGPSPSPTGSPVSYSYPLPSPVPQGTPRIFTVSAVNASGESAKGSPEASWTATPTPTPTPPLPTAPTNIRIIP